jgi:hypothetical protein
MCRAKILYVSLKWDEHVLSICYSYAYHIQNWHIDCSKSTNMKLWHTVSVIASYAAHINIQYFQIIVEHEVQARKKDCTYIDHVNSKHRFCSKLIINWVHILSMLNICTVFNHSQNLDHTQLHKKCFVWFNLYISLKWDRFSFLLLVTCERHTHHSSYSTKLSKNIADEVIEAIKKHECLNLTAHKFCICITYAMLIL